ncbi:MAG: tRNA (adenosine(37)-N6)-threonylcarbamoyltransferase complex transferase subunit TsaD [Clostridiales bacterium]|nr:tRNA (adenosine(37)-N6)-threonylcarbamoyltransferase complex transferase subunit TsaD [Clostridiales bacterium]MCD7828292.1 tRNA (adenosine(37)-N6)-threonylcarbamoyltransferase complex transferase subunit TsaD [Clostridiales bacterium]
MKILAIESSCDETAAAVVEDGRTVLSNVISSQVEEHKIYGGVVPEIASRRHTENISSVVEKALADAGCSYEDVDAIGVTYAPGLIGALLVGVNFAKGLSYSVGKPLIPVHHLRSHIAANYITHPDLKPPFLSLVVSGGHSHIINVKSYTEFEIIGKTRDDAAGECLDKAARAMGVPYPGGANLDKIAKSGNNKSYSFPHPHVENAPLDFSFSGLKTSVINIIHNANQKGEDINIPDLGASFISSVVKCLTDNLMNAAKITGAEKIVAAGGVSANSVLRSELQRLCADKYKLYLPDLSLCGDNGAMVGSQAYYEYLSGNIANESLNAAATMRIDNLSF